MPVDGFSSVTVYTAKGYVEAPEDAISVNNVTAKRNKDGSMTMPRVNAAPRPVAQPGSIGAKGWSLGALCWLCAIAASLSAPGARAESSAEDLAKTLANPVAAMISLPLQLNWDGDIGPDDAGDRLALNVQPVVPFSLNDDWNVISRTILPILHQSDVFPGSGSQTGLGDTVQSFFFSPKAPTAGGWIWGAGPVLLLPTGTDDLLSARKWAAGPTGVVLKQRGPWTYGALANHLWSFAGDGDRSDVDATFVQPFVTYTTPTAWSFSATIESTYDWEHDQLSLPVNLVASKVTKIGRQLVSFGGGVRYWVDSPDSGSEGVGLRLSMTLLFPR